MHILYLTFEAPLSSTGGLGTYIHHVIEQAAQQENQATVLHVDWHSLPPGECIYERNKTTNIIHWNPLKHRVYAYMGHWAATSYAIADKVGELVKEGLKIDYIESCDGYALAYYILNRKLAKETPFDSLKIAVTAHTPISLINKWSGEPQFRIPEYWISEMEKFCLKSADIVICPSHYLKNALEKEFEIHTRKIDVIRNPYQKLDIEQYQVKNKKTTPPQSYDYISASRIHHFKGIPELILGFEKYWLKGGKSTLTIFGADTFSHIHQRPLREFLEEKYKHWIEGRLLVFAGSIKNQELMKIRTQCKALFHPSLHENFPYTVVEHLGAEGIVAASVSGGQAEIIEDGINGFLFDPHNPQSIAACIEKIEALTPGERHLMGSAAKETVAQDLNYKETWEQKLRLLKQPITHRNAYPFIRGKQKTFCKSENEVAGLISVIIPHFNLGDFLIETVDSVLASHYPMLEILVVDDGSTDSRSLAALGEVEAKDKRIRVIRKSNSGVADTRNQGCQAAKGEFIALLDADDLVTPPYYAECIKILQSYSNVSFVGCWNDDFNENGTIRWWTTFNPEPPAQYVLNTTNCQGIVVRRQAFLQYGQHDPELKMFLDDWESTISLLAHGARGVMIPHPMFRYRIRGQSIFRSKQGLWDVNYEKILLKHKSEIGDDAVEAMLFLNENGPNKLYHNPTYPPFNSAGHPRKKYKSDFRQALSDLNRSIKKIYKKN